MEAIRETESFELVPEPFYNDFFRKSNFLISAKYHSSLLENKIMMLGLANVRKDDDGSLVSVMKASYLRELIQKGKKNGSFYDQLYNTSLRMTSRQFVIKNDKGFDIFHLTPRARYDKGSGTFVIYWEKGLEKYLYMVKSNYTQLSIETFMKLESNYSFRLYEILKSRMYVPAYADKEIPVEGFYCHKMSLAELKLDMGAVDSSEAKVREVLVPKKGNNEQPDFEKAVSVAKTKTYERWQNFKTACLDVAVKEVNEKTDIEVEYETVKSGRGGKVTDIIFKMNKKNTPPKEVPKELSEFDKAGFLDNISDLIEEPLKIKDLAAIAEAADYDKEKIEKAYRYMKSSPGDKENVVGYLIAAIKNNYGDNVKAKGKNSFHNFKEREISEAEMQQLELKLIARN